MVLTDKETRLLQAGDIDMRNELIEKNMGLIKMIAYKYGTNYEDDVQDSIALIARRLQQYDGVHNFNMWLCTLARGGLPNMKATSMKTKVQLAPIGYFDETCIETLYADKICDMGLRAVRVRDLLGGALLELTDLQHKVIVMKYIYNMTLESISEVLNVSKAAVWQTVKRGLRNMRKVLYKHRDELMDNGWQEFDIVDAFANRTNLIGFTPIKGVR